MFSAWDFRVAKFREPQGSSGYSVPVVGALFRNAFWNDDLVCLKSGSMPVCATGPGIGKHDSGKDAAMDFSGTMGGTAGRSAAMVTTAAVAARGANTNAAANGTANTGANADAPARPAVAAPGLRPPRLVFPPSFRAPPESLRMDPVSPRSKLAAFSGTEREFNDFRAECVDLINIVLQIHEQDATRRERPAGAPRGEMAADHATALQLARNIQAAMPKIQENFRVDHMATLNFCSSLKTNILELEILAQEKGLSCDPVPAGALWARARDSIMKLNSVNTKITILYSEALGERKKETHKREKYARKNEEKNARNVDPSHAKKPSATPGFSPARSTPANVPESQRFKKIETTATTGKIGPLPVAPSRPRRETTSTANDPGQPAAPPVVTPMSAPCLPSPVSPGRTGDGRKRPAPNGLGPDHAKSRHTERHASPGAPIQRSGTEMAELLETVEDEPIVIPESFDWQRERMAPPLSPVSSPERQERWRARSQGKRNRQDAPLSPRQVRGPNHDVG
jgi:hypothetical protein